MRKTSIPLLIAFAVAISPVSSGAAKKLGRQ